jgi:hypothetical protein
MALEDARCSPSIAARRDLLDRTCSSRPVSFPSRNVLGIPDFSFGRRVLSVPIPSRAIQFGGKSGSKVLAAFSTACAAIFKQL